MIEVSTRRLSGPAAPSVSAEFPAQRIRRAVMDTGADRATLCMKAPSGALHILLSHNLSPGDKDAGHAPLKKEAIATRVIDTIEVHLHLGWNEPAAIIDAETLLSRLDPLMRTMLAQADGYLQALTRNPLERRRRLYLDERGIIVGMSRPAADWLASQATFHVRENRLASTLPHFASMFDALLADRARPFGWRIDPPDEGQRLVITAQPIAHEDTHDLPFAPFTALTILSDEEVPREQLDGLAAAFGWTAREREIVRLLASGTPLQRVAETLRISPQTVTVHIRNANTKAGFRRQVDLIRLVQRA